MKTALKIFKRGHMARKFYANQQRRIVRIQCLWRVKKAREVYRELRREARNVDNIKKLNHGLENKIMELKRKLDEKSELLKASELKLMRADENGAMTDDKINEIVNQLGEVAAERDLVISESAQKDKTIEVYYIYNVNHFLILLVRNCWHKLPPFKIGSSLLKNEQRNLKLKNQNLKQKVANSGNVLIRYLVNSKRYHF